MVVLVPGYALHLSAILQITSKGADQKSEGMLVSFINSSRTHKNVSYVLQWCALVLVHSVKKDYINYFFDFFCRDKIITLQRGKNKIGN